MDNWKIERVIKIGRISIWTCLLSIAIPFCYGVIIGYQKETKMITPYQAQQTIDNPGPLIDLASFTFFVSPIFGLICASEASGRTKQQRITVGEINRKFTKEEIKEAMIAYYANPQIFPWHHIMMVPTWGLKFHLRNGWTGIPKELIKK